jgi:hypothetical protein
MRPSLCLAVAVLFCTVSVVPLHAADAPAAAPTSAPAPPRKVALPKGFKVVTVNNRNVICEPAEEAWVVTALGKVQATTKPATLPAQLLQRLIDQRTPLLQQLARDLALTDLTAAAATYDKDLVGAVRALDEYKPTIYYLVATPDRLADLMRNGWSDPHFYYNRAADAVTFNPVGVLTTDRPQDDVLFPAAYDGKDTPDKRSENLSIAIGSTEASIQASIEIKGRTTVGATFAQLVNDNGVKPLNLKEDQQWFGLGMAAILSAKYAAAITLEPAAGLMDMLTMEHPANPLKTSAVDLVHPQDTKLMREEALPAYYDTVRRKSARAVRFLIDKGGEQALPKTIVAIRDKKPADGPALVAVIKAATGVDLTPQLARGS